MFSFVRYVKHRKEENTVLLETVTHSVWYDLCALYVFCDPVSLSLYFQSDRVTPWLFLTPLPHQCCLPDSVVESNLRPRSEVASLKACQVVVDRKGEGKRGDAKSWERMISYRNDACLTKKHKLKVECFSSLTVVSMGAGSEWINPHHPC